jgi:hypothetical protein
MMTAPTTAANWLLLISRTCCAPPEAAYSRALLTVQISLVRVGHRFSRDDMENLAHQKEARDRERTDQASAIGILGEHRSSPGMLNTIEYRDTTPDKQYEDRTVEREAQAVRDKRCAPQIDDRRNRKHWIKKNNVIASPNP